MDLEGILAISGKPGLYQLISQTRGGILVESLDNGKKFPIPATAQVSALSDIAIYSYTEEVPLSTIFSNMAEKEEGKECSVKPKSKPDELKNYFSEILEDYDEDRVYPSDIKKVVSWYNQLQKQGKIAWPLEEAKAEESTEEKAEEA